MQQGFRETPFTRNLHLVGAPLETRSACASVEPALHLPAQSFAWQRDPPGIEPSVARRRHGLYQRHYDGLTVRKV